MKNQQSETVSFEKAIGEFREAFLEAEKLGKEEGLEISSITMDLPTLDGIDLVVTVGRNLINPNDPNRFTLDEL